jgi:hypothetical protein
VPLFTLIIYAPHLREGYDNLLTAGAYPYEQTLDCFMRLWQAQRITANQGRLRYLLL